MTKAQKIFIKYALLRVTKTTKAISNVAKTIGGKLQPTSFGKAPKIPFGPKPLSNKGTHNVLGSSGKNPLK